MLKSVHPLLTGRLLLHLDEMGHSDVVVVGDAFFPARSLAQRFVDLPGTTVGSVLEAIVTVLPLDDAPALLLMAGPEGQLPLHADLRAAASVHQEGTRLLDRQPYYDLAAHAYVIVRSGDTRPFANAALRKGIVNHLRDTEARW